MSNKRKSRNNSKRNKRKSRNNSKRNKRKEKKIIDIRNIDVFYGKFKVLNNVTFYAREGEIAGVIGASGSGKTTLLRIITGQLKPKKGEVAVSNIDLRKNSEAISYVTGYVPQLEYLSLYQTFSALENAVHFGRMYHLEKKEIHKRAKKILKILDFNEDLMDNPVSRLSGGEKKRVSIAVGMIHEPKILLLDEPTTGLDAHLRHEVLNYLKRLNYEMGTTMIIISHDLEIVDYCNRIMILENGNVSKWGTPEELLQELPGKGKSIEMTFSGITWDLLRKLKKLPNVSFITRAGRNKIRVFTENTEEKLIEYFGYLDKEGIPPKDISIRRINFVDYFRAKPWTDSVPQ
ncbi:MAG: ABC transporter ATP-binding protein [Candidatus Ranarchaeia archaeon]